MIIKNSVLLLKSQVDESDKYAALLKANGYQVNQIKTLEFVFKNLNNLQEKLNNPDKYSGIALSSPRCVEAVCKALDGRKIDDSWKAKRNYVVGEATYEAALKLLELKCFGKESGNAVNLAKIIVENKNLFSKPFLFPHGNLKTGVLNLELKKDSLELDEVLVYDTVASTSLEKDIAKVTDNFSQIPEFLVFFSPSGLKNSIDFLRKIPVDLQSVKFVAIGSVTETAIKSENLPVFNVSTNPTPKDVLNAIKSEKN